MTPEELNRTIEFIIQSQARLAAAQEQDRADRLGAEKELKAFDRRLARLLEVQVQLLETQSHRLDDAEKRHEETLRQMRLEHAESLERLDQVLLELDRILGRLTDRLN